MMLSTYTYSTSTYIDFEVEHNDKHSKNKYSGVWWPFEDIKI